MSLLEIRHDRRNTPTAPAQIAERTVGPPRHRGVLGGTSPLKVRGRDRRNTPTARVRGAEGA